MSRRSTGPDRRMRQLVTDRDGGMCRRCGVRPGEQCHHRRPRQMGGSRLADTNLPANLVTLCSACHASIESNREVGYVTGWLVHRGNSPASIPLVDLFGWRFHLDNEGGITPARLAV